MYHVRNQFFSVQTELSDINTRVDALCNKVDVLATTCGNLEKHIVMLCEKVNVLAEMYDKEAERKANG